MSRSKQGRYWKGGIVSITLKETQEMEERRGEETKRDECWEEGAGEGCCKIEQTGEFKRRRGVRNYMGRGGGGGGEREREREGVVR